MKKNHVGSSTKLNHPKKVEVLTTNPPLISPIYQAVKYVVSDEVSYGEQFIYSRFANPTVRELEWLLADYTGKADCIVLSSGLAAITGMLLGLLKAGDHIITFRELYRPARMFIRDTLPRFGVEASILELNDFEGLERVIRPGKTRIIHFESPTNPNLKIADIGEIIRMARKYNILVTMDGTFAGLHQHLDFDLDLIVHSLTKYANGHGDVLAGAILGKKDLIQLIRPMTISLGASLDAQAAYLISRGLKTYDLRIERHTQNAQRVADFLNTHPMVEKVFYPGLSHHKDHQLAIRQMKDMGSVVSCILKPEAKMTAEAFCHRLKLIKFAVSLGATESIICPTIHFFGDDLSSIDKEQMEINQRSLRLSVGLENIEDLIEDLHQALS